MIRFCTYLLLLALTLQSFYRSIMVLDYDIHLPDYLAKCMNRDRPQLHCNGQCILMQKIKQKEEEETKKNFSVYAYNAYYVHTEQIDLLLSPTVDVQDVVHFSFYQLAYHYAHPDEVYRPPIA